MLLTDTIQVRKLEFIERARQSPSLSRYLQGVKWQNESETVKSQGDKIDNAHSSCNLLQTNIQLARGAIKIVLLGTFGLALDGHRVGLGQ